jgi:WhiB family transcriptional regulator, redox-sensing transcriptional regulator
MSWYQDAACKGMNPKLFYAEGQSQASIEIVRRAREVCAGCSVRGECLEVGLTQDLGVWGGMSVEERRAVKRQRRRSAA